MIEEPPLLSIQRIRNRPDPEQIAAFETLPASVVSDAMWGAGAFGPDINPLAPDMRVAGPALTVECRPGDLLPLLGALAYIQPGDIVVAATSGHRAHATAGDRISGMMKNAGAIALITDGTLRDAPGILETGLQAWCSGLTPASPVSKAPGRIGTPVQIAGQTVRSGDMILADQDGVVVVPFEDIDRVASRSREIMTLETDLDQAVREGLVVPEAIQDLLASDQAVFIDP